MVSVIAFARSSESGATTHRTPKALRANLCQALLVFAKRWTAGRPRTALQRKRSVNTLHVRGLVRYPPNLRGIRLRSVLCVAQVDRALAAG